MRVFTYCSIKLIGYVFRYVGNIIEGGTVKVQVVQDNISTSICVVDDGEGIDEEYLLYIFERFYKADNSSANSVGIGLALAKQIILKQNGTITVSSKKGEGTEFVIKIFRMDTV